MRDAKFLFSDHKTLEVVSEIVKGNVPFAANSNAVELCRNYEYVNVLSVNLVTVSSYSNYARKHVYRLHCQRH